MVRKRRVFEPSKNLEVEDWSNCTVSAVNSSGNRVRVIVRRTKTVKSQYRKRDVTLRYMVGFDVSQIQDPTTDEYNEPQARSGTDTAYGPPRPRWVFQLDQDYWVWQWADQGKQIEDSAVFSLFQMIKRKMEAPDFSKSSIFDIPIQDDERVIPVVYQPAIDTWKNFVREIHCHRTQGDEFEVTILFNNEQLRRHAVLNRAYEWFRSWFFGRTIDVETFHIVPEKTPEAFKFTGIYSGKGDIIEDACHGDKPDINGKVPLRKVRYYFGNTRHPVVFINTSNHAMAERDNNNTLLKWEYLVWDENGPVVYGTMSRAEIDRSFKRKLRLRR